MIPAEFDYVRPADLAEALAILRDREGEAKVLAGGYSLLPLVKLRLAQPGLLVDLRDVGGLDTIEVTPTGLLIGARATHRRIHDDVAIRARHPMLREAAAGIGDPQVRNWGTIGGSVAHADPSADWPAVLIAADAALLCQSAGGGSRTIPAREFFLDAFSTALTPTEVLTQVSVPSRPDGAGGAYLKLERRAGDFATVGVAAALRVGPDGRIDLARIGLTAVAETPFAATDAEAVLLGAEPTPATFDAAARAAAAQSRPAADGHGPVEYKRAMVGELTRRALARALERTRDA